MFALQNLQRQPQLGLTALSCLAEVNVYLSAGGYLGDKFQDKYFFVWLEPQRCGCRGLGITGSTEVSEKWWLSDISISGGKFVLKQSELEVDVVRVLQDVCCCLYYAPLDLCFGPEVHWPYDCVFSSGAGVSVIVWFPIACLDDCDQWVVSGLTSRWGTLYILSRFHVNVSWETVRLTEWEGLDGSGGRMYTRNHGRMYTRTTCGR